MPGPIRLEIESFPYGLGEIGDDDLQLRFSGFTPVTLWPAEKKNGQLLISLKTNRHLANIFVAIKSFFYPLPRIFSQFISQVRIVNQLDNGLG